MFFKPTIAAKFTYDEDSKTYSYEVKKGFWIFKKVISEGFLILNKDEAINSMLKAIMDNK